MKQIEFSLNRVQKKEDYKQQKAAEKSEALLVINKIWFSWIITICEEMYQQEMYDMSEFNRRNLVYI